jgi:hypothetical protein
MSCNCDRLTDHRSTLDLPGHKCPGCGTPYNTDDPRWRYASYILFHQCCEEYGCYQELGDCLITRKLDHLS